MLSAISELGFTGKVVDEPAEAAAVPGVRVDVKSLPQPLKDTFERAAKDGRLVIVDIHGPG